MVIKLYQKADILLKYYREGLSQREIERITGISRKTIRKRIKEFEAKLKELSITDDNKQIQTLIHEITNEPKYNSFNRKKVKLTDEVIEEIQKCLDENQKKKSTGRSKQIMKKIDIHEYLIDKGFDISYPSVCKYIREEKEKKEAFIRQEYQLGETLEFDWGEVKLVINEKLITLNLAVFIIAKGSYHFSRLYNNKKMENFLDSHVQVFNNIGGIHREVIYDNLKQAVKCFVGKNEKEATDDLIKISLYYGFKYRFCNSRKGNEKGHVERGVEVVRRKVFSRRDKFDSIEEANAYLYEMLDKLNSKPRKQLNNKCPKDMLKEESEYLFSLKPSYDVSRRVELRVNKYSVVTIDQNKYSVPDYLVGKFVIAKIYPNDINIYYKNSLLCTHKRNYNAHRWIIDINHFIYTLKKKPGALHNSAGRHQMSPQLQSIYNNYYINNPKDFIVLLELIKENELSNILKAIDELATIKKSIVNTDNIKNILLKGPLEQNDSSNIDDKIKSSSINLINDINNLFNLDNKGGLLN